MDAGILANAISAVCPVVSVTVRDPNDRASWSFISAASATGPQISAANNVVATIAVAVLNIIPWSVFLQRWTDPEYTLLMQKRATAIGAGNVTLVRQWDIAGAQGSVDLNSPAAQNFKAALVSNTILSQSRADIIFS
jgi:hypothetical protein